MCGLLVYADQSSGLLTVIFPHAQPMFLALAAFYSNLITGFFLVELRISNLILFFSKEFLNIFLAIHKFEEEKKTNTTTTTKFVHIFHVQSINLNHINIFLDFSTQ